MIKINLYYIISIIIILLYQKSKLQLFYLQYFPKSKVLDGDLIDSKYEFDIYNKENNDIVNIFNIENLYKSNQFKFYYNYIQKDLKFIHPVHIEYSNDLTLNRKKLQGNHLILSYKLKDNYTYIENVLDTSNIESILNQIHNFNIETNNELIFLDYFINVNTNDILVKTFIQNKNKKNSYILNVLFLISILLQNDQIIHLKKVLYYIIGNLIITIDKMDTTPINNLSVFINDDIFMKKKEMNIENILKFKKNIKKYKISGLDVTDKKIKEIKKIIENKPKLNKIDNHFIKNNFIASGLFANVYKNGDRVLKILKKDKMFSKEINKEIEVSVKINNIKNANKYFPKFYGAFLAKHNNETILYLEYDYIEGITFGNYIKTTKKMNNLSKIIDNIISGNSFLNESGIIRLDNHLNNIIVNKNLEVKYIDLGRTFISKNPSNNQLDQDKYFNLLIKICILIINIDVKNKIQLLNKVLKEFSSTLSKVSSKNVILK